MQYLEPQLLKTLSGFTLRLNFNRLKLEKKLRVLVFFKYLSLLFLLLWFGVQI